MTKYDAVWDHVMECGSDVCSLTFTDIERIAGVPVDHSFLMYKKEIESYGWSVKVSMKSNTVTFRRDAAELRRRSRCRWRPLL